MSNGSNNYDLIIVGGGAIGLSTAYSAVQSGLKTLVLEKDTSLLNQNGASAGYSRQFRLQYAVQYMAELCLASVPFWNALQQYALNYPLVGKDGSLWFGDPAFDSREGNIKASEKVMDKLGIAYTKLNAQQIESKYHFPNLKSTYSGFFQPGGGIINLTLTLGTMLEIIGQLGPGSVDIHQHEPVTNITSTSGGGITVTTGQGQYSAGKLAITAGPWVNDMVGFFGLEVPIIIWEMCSAYFKVTDPSYKYETWFYYGGEKNDFYGFPQVDWPFQGYIRVAPDFPDKVIQHPSQRNSKPDPKNLELTSQFVAQHMKGVDHKPQFASTCLAPLARSEDPNVELLLDYAPPSVPNNKQIVVYTAGWAGKFIPILGNMICQMLTNSNLTSFNYSGYTIPLSNFAIGWNTHAQRRRLR
jgi:glycine/D-amino acid oxidase-like deaminating enzyme